MLFWVTFWPGGDAGRHGGARGLGGAPREGCAIPAGWLVPSWIVFELVVTKLPHYVLPLYPAIAILIAGVLESHRLARQMAEWGTAWWFWCPLSGVGMAVGLVMFGRQSVCWPGRSPLAPGLGFLAWRLFERRRGKLAVARDRRVDPDRRLRSSAYRPVAHRTVPERAAGAHSCARRLRNPVAAAAGYQEPSLVYLGGHSTRLLDGPGAADFLRGRLPLRIRRGAAGADFLRRADAIGLRYSPGPRARRIQHPLRAFGFDRDLPSGRRP